MYDYEIDAISVNKLWDPFGRIVVLLPGVKVFYSLTEDIVGFQYFIVHKKYQYHVINALTFFFYHIKKVKYLEALSPNNLLR